MSAGWIVLIAVGGLILLIAILLQFSVVCKIEYKGDFIIKAKYLFITLYSLKDKKTEKSKKSKKSKKTEKVKKSEKTEVKSLLPLEEESEASEKKAEKEESPLKKQLTSLSNAVGNANKESLDFEAIKLIYDTAKSPFKKLIRKTRVIIYDLDIKIGGDDAAKIALTYGAQSAAVGAFLAWLKGTVKLKVKKARVNADFSSEETKQYLKAAVKIKVFTALVALARFAVKSAQNKKQGEIKPKKEKQHG